MLVFCLVFHYMNQPKYIFVVGGVMSGVGKGVTSASLGVIMQSKGYRVTALKADPYVNVDAGTMNPVEHGETFVTGDGDETDQDMGNYERFLHVDLTRRNYMTTGRIYQSVIAAERAMKYEGRCVQVVPHVPEEILRRIHDAQAHHDAEVTIVEIGGTVGEYENILFLEAVRELKLKHPQDVAIVLVSYLPVPSHLGEMKTKPTQHAQRALNSAGLHADIIVARGPQPLDDVRREKLAMMCGVAPERSISAPDAGSVYEVPRLLDAQGIGNSLLEVLHLPHAETRFGAWNDLVDSIESAKKPVRIAVVGKYFGTGDYTLADSYISVIEALKHASWHLGADPILTWVDAETFEQDPSAVAMLQDFDGVLVPGGFGARGIEGILSAIQYVREQEIPYFGICYGMQLACVEFARNVVGLSGAHTQEVQPDTSHPIIIVNPHQARHLEEEKYGATMRLGSYDCTLTAGSVVERAYQASQISERHRHRYEFHNQYRKPCEDAGLCFSGVHNAQDLVEIIELPEHPFFVGVQFHPEFQSRPLTPHPLFCAFIRAAIAEELDVVV
jgi:CTP synthase